MRALLRDTHDDTCILVNINELTYDPNTSELIINTGENTYIVKRVGSKEATDISKELLVNGYIDLYSYPADVEMKYTGLDN